MPRYTIERPPLSETFYLPPKDILLALRPGNLVKIMFRVEDEGLERMWIRITEQADISEWKGELDNDPAGEKMGKVLKLGDEVSFHPLDIIQIWEDGKE